MILNVPLFLSMLLYILLGCIFDAVFFNFFLKYPIQKYLILVANLLVVAVGALVFFVVPQLMLLGGTIYIVYLELLVQVATRFLVYMKFVPRDKYQRLALTLFLSTGLANAVTAITILFFK